MNEMMLWVDIETTGLDVNSDFLLEAAFALTNKDGEIESIRKFVISDMEYGGIAKIRDKCIKVYNENLPKDFFVLSTHDNNNLFREIQGTDALTLEEAEVEILEWFEEINIPLGRLPMTGSSCHFDRSFLKYFLPGVENCFHYRNIDISSVKELCKLHNMRVYENLTTVHQNKVHRGIPDLQDSINEYRFYLDNFLFVD